MSSSASPAQPSSPSNDVPPFFETGASPPLIIGFIAIGAFTFGMVVLAVWRRTHSHRAVRAARPSYVEPQKKPHLHEVWIGGTGAGELRWADVMPMAAKIERVSNHAPSSASSKPWSIPERRWLRRNRVTDVEAREKERAQSVSDKDDGAVLDQEGTLEVAVLLAMPSPRRAKREEAGISIDASVTDEAEYSLGTLEIPWVGEHSGLEGKGGSTSKTRTSFVYR